jgi:hypothetical protein
MVEGFWIVQFEGVQGGGGGVAVFTNGKVLGGDSGYTYIGTYEVNQTSVKARVKVHQFLAGVPNVLGVQGDFELLLDGVVTGDNIKAQASLAGKQGIGLAVKLTRRSAL